MPKYCGPGGGGVLNFLITPIQVGKIVMVKDVKDVNISRSMLM